MGPVVGISGAGHIVGNCRPVVGTPAVERLSEKCRPVVGISAVGHLAGNCRPVVGTPAVERLQRNAGLLCVYLQWGI
jgi:hypothetical protein